MYRFLVKFFSRQHPHACLAAVAQPASTYQQTFILEPILTPSGLVDSLEDAPPLPSPEMDLLDPIEGAVEGDGDAIDVISETLIELETVESLPDELESIGFIDNPDAPAAALADSELTFDSGVFTVGKTGKVSIDFLFDGGRYRGEVAIFSLEGMEAFEPGSEAFIQEAASRSLSHSPQGHIVFVDRIEGARFEGTLGEHLDWNDGQYLGMKTVDMEPGDEFGIMLVPNGSVQQVFDNPGAEGSLRPLFSMATANPEDHFHVGQLADVTGDGNTFVFEDQRIDTGSDGDYNDLIFRFEGAKGEAVNLDEVIAPEYDWRETALGTELLDYAASFLKPYDPILVLAPEGTTEIELAPLFPTLLEGEDWTFEILDAGIQELNPQIEGDVLIVENYSHVEIERIAIKATNTAGNSYIRQPVLIANGPDPATTTLVTNLLAEFGDVFESFPDDPNSAQVEELSALVHRFDSLVEDQPALLKFLVKPDTLSALGFEQPEVDTAYQLLHSDQVGQLLGLPDSLHEALAGSDASAWEQRLIEAHALPDPLPQSGFLHLIGFIDFAEQRHDQKTLTTFNALQALETQDYTLIRADEGNWAEKLTQFVDRVRASGMPGAVVNLGFDLTQFDDLGHLTTRYELTPAEQQAIQYARENNVLLIAASGNTGDKMSALGAAAAIFDNILTVGAVNRWEEKADYSAQGNGLSLVAPGGQWETDPEAFVGTSKATAYVTAAASLVWQANPTLNYRQVANILLQAADDLGEPGWDPETGAGLLDVAEAILIARKTEGETVPETETPPITPYNGEGRVTPDIRPNASNAVKGALQSLETSQAQILNEWDQLRQVGSSELPIEELAQTLQGRTETTLNLHQELTTLAAVAAAAEQQELEKYTLLSEQKNQKIDKIEQLQQQLASLEQQQTQIAQFIESAPQDVNPEVAQELEQIAENIDTLLEEISSETESISYELKSILWHNVKEEKIYKKLPFIGRILVDTIYRIEPIPGSRQVNDSFQKTTSFKEAEATELEALKLKTDVLEDRAILEKQIQAFEREKLSAVGDFLNGTIAILQQEIDSEQQKLGDLDRQQLEIIDRLNLLRGDLDTSIQEIQAFLNVLGLGLPTKKLQEEFAAINSRIDDRLNSLNLDPDALTQLRQIHKINQAKIAILEDSQLQEVIQSPHFNILVETVSAAELQQLKNALWSNNTPQNGGLTENGQALHSLLQDFSGDRSQFLEVLNFTETIKTREEEYAAEHLSWQALAAKFEAEQDTFLASSETNPLIQGSFLETLSEVVDRKQLFNFLEQLNLLIEKEIQLATEENQYHEQANAAAQGVWYVIGDETFYNASQAALQRFYQQSASEIAHQRNLNWQTRQSIVEALSQLDLHLDAHALEAFNDPDRQTQLAAELPVQAERIEQLEANLLAQISVPDPAAPQKLADLQRFKSSIGAIPSAAQAFSHAAIEKAATLADQVEFGTIASIFDVDFFENYVEPKVWDTQRSLEEQRQALEAQLAASYQILELLTENTVSVEEIHFLRTPELLEGTVSPIVAHQLAEKADFLEGIAGVAEQLTGYIQELEQSKTDVEAANGTLQAALSQAGVSLTILRQKQEYQFRQQLERNQAILELVRAQAAAEAGINQGTLTSYAAVQDQLREEIRKSILNWSEALKLEHTLTQDIPNQHSRYSHLLDSLLLALEGNLAAPHRQYQEALKDYEQAFATLEVHSDAAIQGKQVIDRLAFDNQLQKLELEQDADFWKEIAFVAERYGVETPELQELNQVQLAFVQHPDVLSRLQELRRHLAAKRAVLWSQFETWKQSWRQIEQTDLYPLLNIPDFFFGYTPATLPAFSYFGNEQGAELKQVENRMRELDRIISVIRETLSSETENSNPINVALTDSVNTFFKDVEKVSSTYVDWLKQKIENSQHDGIDATIYEISKSFALPSGTRDSLANLNNRADSYTENISELLGGVKNNANRVWSYADAKYREAYAADARRADYIEQSKEILLAEVINYARKEFNLNLHFQTSTFDFIYHDGLLESIEENKGFIRNFFHINIVDFADNKIKWRLHLSPYSPKSSTYNDPVIKWRILIDRGEPASQRENRFYDPLYKSNTEHNYDLIDSRYFLKRPDRSLLRYSPESYLSDRYLALAEKERRDFDRLFQQSQSYLRGYERNESIEALRQAESDRWVETIDSIGEAKAYSDFIKSTLDDLLTARERLPEKQANLINAELDLHARRKELENISVQVAASEFAVDQAWSEYGISSSAYLAAVQQALVDRGQIDREGVELRGSLWELDRLLEDRLLDLSAALSNAEALVDLLTQELEAVTQQIATAASGTDLTNSITKQALLKENLRLAEYHFQALNAQHEALVQKRNFVAIFNQGVEASQQLIDAYFKSPDPDAEALKSLLLQVQASIAEADRLAKEAEERSKTFQLSLENWEDTLIAQQDSVLQQVQQQRAHLGNLIQAVELKIDRVEEATDLQIELNSILQQIIELLEKAGEEGNRQADLLRQVAFENRVAVINEVQGIDYTDLSKHEDKSLKELADRYVKQAAIHQRKQQTFQAAAYEARLARLTAEAMLTPQRILTRDPYRAEFHAVEEQMYEVLEIEPRSLWNPADFSRQAALLPPYFDWLEAEFEKRRILKKALEHRKRNLQAKTSTILEIALSERWQELVAKNAITLTRDKYLQRNLDRYTTEFKDESALNVPILSQGVLKKFEKRLSEVVFEVDHVFPERQATAQAYRDWIYGQIQITETEKARIQADLGLSNEEVEKNQGLYADSDAVREEIARLTQEIETASGNIEALQQELRLAGVRRQGLEENLEQVQQAYSGLLSWEWVYIAQAQLEKTLAEESQTDLEIATEEWIEREAAAIELERWQAAAQISALQQRQAEFDWQTALNLARGELGLADLDTVTAPDKTKLAELLAQLESLETEQPDLPDDLKLLLTEVQGQVHSALQGEEASSLTDRLLELINRFSEQVTEHQAAIQILDGELETDYALLEQLLNDDLKAVVDALNTEAKTSQELQDKINELDADLRATWDRIAAATQDFIASEVEAKNLRDWIEGVIEQRIKKRKARRRARWFKAFGIIAMIISAVATIVTAGGFSAIAAGILALVAAGIQATMAGINKNWTGLAISVVQAVLSFMPALGTIADSAGNSLIAPAVASSIQSYGTAVVSAINSGQAFASGNGLLGIIEAFGAFSSLVAGGLSQVLAKVQEGVAAVSEETQKIIQSTLTAIKDLPKQLYAGVEGIKSGDIGAAISGFFNAIITLGSEISGHFSTAATDIIKSIGKLGKTVLIVEKFIKHGGIFPLDQLLDLFKEDLAELIKDAKEEWAKEEQLNEEEEVKKILEAAETLSEEILEEISQLGPEEQRARLLVLLDEVPPELKAQVVDQVTSRYAEMIEEFSLADQLSILRNLPPDLRAQVVSYIRWKYIAMEAAASPEQRDKYLNDLYVPGEGLWRKQHEPLLASAGKLPDTSVWEKYARVIFDFAGGVASSVLNNITLGASDKTLQWVGFRIDERGEAYYAGRVVGDIGSFVAGGVETIEGLKLAGAGLASGFVFTVGGETIVLLPASVGAVAAGVAAITHGVGVVITSAKTFKKDMDLLLSRGKPFQGGKQSKRDKKFGINDDDFWKWWHKEKGPYGDDIPNREEALEIYNDWEKNIKRPKG